MPHGIVTQAALRIGLFGGTFDPVHLGHVHLAALAREALSLDQVRFLPCRISPHKTGTTPRSAEDRLAMLKLATADLPWAVVDDHELQHDGPSFTWQTVEAMHAAYPAAHLFLIMGGDQWRALPTWAKPERIAGLVEFIVFPRGEKPEARSGFSMHAIEGMHPASATAIREALAAGETMHPWLDPKVGRWLADHS